MMLYFILLLLSCTTRLFVAQDYEEQFVEADPELEKYLREAIENFREQMKVGIPVINMPVLDPLHLENLDINVDENLATMSLKIKEFEVQRLSIFNVTKLKPNLEEFYLEIDLTFPKLNLQGHYDVDGKFVKIFPIFGNGHFQINVTDIIISGTGQLGYATDTFEMAMLKLDLTWKHMVVRMENFMKGDSFSEMLQTVVPALGRDIFHAYKPLIMDQLQVQVCLTDMINEKFNDTLIKDIIKGIIPLH